jgi:hypothetical protein
LDEHNLTTSLPLPRSHPASLQGSACCSRQQQWALLLAWAAAVCALVLLLLLAWAAAVAPLLQVLLAWAAAVSLLLLQVLVRVALQARLTAAGRAAGRRRRCLQRLLVVLPPLALPPRAAVGLAVAAAAVA